MNSSSGGGQKKRVAIFINSLEGGGAERVVSNLLQVSIDKLDLHLVLLHPDIVYEIPDGLPVFMLEKRRTANSFLKILKLPLLAFRYFRFLKREKIDLSLSFLNRPNFINCLQKTLGWRGKVVLSEQVASSAYYLDENLHGKIGRFLIKNLYPKADLIIPASEGIRQDLEKTFHLRTSFQVINNPVNLDFIQKKLDEPNIPHSSSPISKFTFINVGRFQHQKNHELLIEAFSKIAHLDCRLLLLGDGFLRKNIEQQIEKLGLQGKVELLGFVENPYTVLAKANCFVLSSDFEGFPNVVLEALACGLPVISTDCPTGPREILGGSATAGLLPECTKFGWLTPMRDADFLAACMKNVFSDFKNWGGDRDKFRQRAGVFDLKLILKKYENALEQLKTL